MKNVFEGKNQWYRKLLIKLGGNKVLQSGLCATMFVLSFAHLTSRALSCDPSDDCVMPHAEVQVRAKASQGNLSVFMFPSI